MPRPIFGQADWWTFEGLDDVAKFERFPEGRWEGFATKQANAADELARSMFEFDDVDTEIDADGSRDSGYPTWPGLEFCVSRGTRTVLMVRRRE